MKREFTYEVPWKSDIYMYIENNSQEHIIINVENIAVNEFIISSDFATNVLPGKKRYESFKFTKNDFEDHTIESIKNMTFNLKISKDTSSDTILSISKIKVDFE